jgi:hypothetical protein
MGWNPRHPGILDAKLFLEEGQLAAQPVDLGPEAGPSAPVVGSPRHHGDEGIVAEGQDLDNG